MEDKPIVEKSTYGIIETSETDDQKAYRFGPKHKGWKNVHFFWFYFYIAVN